MVDLDKKEALLLHLRSMNDEAAAGMHADAAGRASPQFVNAYSSVVLQLRDVSSTLPARPPARPPACLHAMCFSSDEFILVWLLRFGGIF